MIWRSLLLGSAAAASLFTSPLSADEGPATAVVLRLTPVAASPDRPGAMLVEETIAPVGTSLVLTLDMLAPSLERVRDKVSDLTVRDVAGVLSLAGPIVFVDGSTATWTATRRVSGAVHLSYRMPNALAHPRKRGPQVDLQVIGDGTSGAFSGLLLAPTGRLHATAHRVVPPGEQAVSSLGDGDIEVTGSDAALRQALFLTGRLQALPTSLPPHGEAVVGLGSGLRLGPMADWLGRVYDAERRAFGTPGDARFRVLVRSHDGGPFSSGRAAPGGFLFYLPRGQMLDTLSHRATIAHEYVHSLSTNLDDEVGNQGCGIPRAGQTIFAPAPVLRRPLYSH